MAAALERFFLKVPKLLLPKQQHRDKWPIVACDQYTSEPEYWNSVASDVGDAPSMLHLMLPEIYLDGVRDEAMIPHIHAAMHDYLRRGIFEEVEGMVYMERKTHAHEQWRRGLVVCLDLEQYDYIRADAPTVSSPIRPTEGTVVERIPPRLRVRQAAPIESPHIMVLVDDPSRSLIEPLGRQCQSFEKLYDQPLMKNSGHIRGWRVPESAYEGIARALEGLANPAAFQTKYHVDGRVPLLLYAIGDGNHSLATAKRLWTNIKAGAPNAEALAQLMATHPARYAMVEISNLYDEAIEFEPIHRVLFEVHTPILPRMEQHYGPALERRNVPTFEAMVEDVKRHAAHPTDKHYVGLVQESGYTVLGLPRGEATLPVGALQPFLDVFMKSEPKGAKEIDYVHGDDVMHTKGRLPHNCSFFLPCMSKHELFLTVIKNGVLPRKTFSMGHADEKRFYFECRAIVPDAMPH